jgi:hypothetical protein
MKIAFEKYRITIADTSIYCFGISRINNVRFKVTKLSQPLAFTVVNLYMPEAVRGMLANM